MLFNIFHTYITAIIVIFLGVLLSNSTALAFGLIWSAHIGMDRMIGYGLKYSTEFKDIQNLICKDKFSLTGALAKYGHHLDGLFL